MTNCTLIDLLRRARARLDASYCEGRLVGPDRELAQEIDDAIVASKPDPARHQMIEELRRAARD